MEQDFTINCDCIRFLSVRRRKKKPHNQIVADKQERDGSILIETSGSFAVERQKAMPSCGECHW